LSSCASNVLTHSAGGRRQARRERAGAEGGT
jgi:hypothetical protein